MKIFIALIFTLIANVALAQNVQLHYDLGSATNDDLKGRPKITTTVEMFKIDRWGNNFFFVDMDYTGNGIASAYWEIARELKFWEKPIAIHVEYNGGLANQFSLQNAYLLGPSYAWNNNIFSKGFTLTPMYKRIQKNTQPDNFQLTATWYIHFANNQLWTFSGFADLWKEKTINGNYIFLAEPQLWANLNKLHNVDDHFNLSLGTEVELSNNFAGRDGFYVIPTLAIKWNF